MISADIRRQVGQLLWIGIPKPTASDDDLRRLRAGEAGSVILFRQNIESVEQLIALNRTLHDAAPADGPLLVSVDQEGGKVQRLRAPAVEWPPMLRLGEQAARNEAQAVVLAERVGRALGAELAAVGFDLDFAPVLDVHTNPANPVIGDRAFATTPELVARLAGAFARGLASAGIIPCGKHFPGHGDTALDSHLHLPRVDHDEARLRRIELAPFAALPDLPILMTAHVVFSALDDVPATLSSKILQGLLRGELGYRGIIVSDDLEMKAIADNYGLEEATVRALLAGCDAFLVCHLQDWQQRVFDALVRAAETRAEVRARVAESAARIMDLKRVHFGKPRPPIDPSLLGAQAHRALAAEMG